MIECKQCGTEFSTILELDKHIIAKHPTTVGDKILGLNMWNMQPKLNDRKTKGHLWSLEEHDKFDR